MKIILASGSEARKRLLKKIGLKFQVLPSRFNEAKIKRKFPDRLIKARAKAKAFEVAKRVGEAIVIAADTMVLFKRKILGKPKNLEEAIRMLEMLSGKTCRVKTGFCLLNTKTGQKIVDLETTCVKMKPVTKEIIRKYIRKEKPLDKSGAFAIESQQAKEFVEKIRGSYSNVIGLPIEKIKPIIDQWLND